MKRILLTLALVAVATLGFCQAASLPYQLQWGEQVQGGQVYQNDKFITDRLERCFTDAYQGTMTLETGSEEVASAATITTDKGSDMDASGTFTAPFTGYYRVCIQGGFAAGTASGVRQIRAMVASTTYVCAERAEVTENAAISLSSSQIVAMDADDVMDVKAYQTGDATLNATVSWQIEGLPWQ